MGAKMSIGAMAAAEGREQGGIDVIGIIRFTLQRHFHRSVPALVALRHPLGILYGVLVIALADYIKIEPPIATRELSLTARARKTTRLLLLSPLALCFIPFSLSPEAIGFQFFVSGLRRRFLTIPPFPYGFQHRILRSLLKLIVHPVGKVGVQLFTRLQPFPNLLDFR